VLALRYVVFLLDMESAFIRISFCMVSTASIKFKGHGLS